MPYVIWCAYSLGVVNIIFACLAKAMSRDEEDKMDWMDAKKGKLLVKLF